MREVGIFQDLAKLYDPGVHGPGGLPYPIGDIIAGPQSRQTVIDDALRPLREFWPIAAAKLHQLHGYIAPPLPQMDVVFGVRVFSSDTHRYLVNDPN